MEFRVIIAIFSIFISLISYRSAAEEILCLFGVGTETAEKWNKVVLTELVRKGHKLTVVTPIEWKRKHDDVDEEETNINLVHLENTQQFLHERYQNNNNSQSSLGYSNWKLIINWYDHIMATCRGNLESNGLSEALHLGMRGKRSFDMIIYDLTYGPGCLLHLAYLFGNIPIVGLTSSSITPDVLKVNKEFIFNPALDPYGLSDFSTNMNYWQRLYNTALYGFDYCYRQWVVRPVIEGLWSHNIRAYNLAIPKSLDEIQSRFKIILANHHPALHTLTSLPDNVIPVPGLHIDTKPTTRLNKDLLKFIENSNLGIFLIDLDLTQLPDQHVGAIMNVIYKYSEYGFIWTSGGKSKKIPKNVPVNLFLGNNFQIKDVLEHRKVTAVLTIPEILRVQECLYHGVPIITITLRPEQRNLAKRIEDNGFGITLQLTNIDNAAISLSLDQTLTNKNLLNKVKQVQLTLRNRQTSSLATAVWWVENLLQNPTMNDDLLSVNKVRLGFFTSNSLDIWLFFEFLILIFIINMILVCRQTIQNFKKISKAKKRKQTEQKKDGKEKEQKLKKDKKSKTKTS